MNGPNARLTIRPLRPGQPRPQARAALPKSRMTSGGGFPASTGEAYFSS